MCSGTILAKPSVCILAFSNTRYWHSLCTDVSFSAPHLLHEGIFVLLILCSIYCRLICLVRSPTNILQSFLSSLLMNWTYLLVGRFRQLAGPVPFTDSTFCLFPFFNQISYFGLNLLNSGRKGSRPLSLTCLQSRSAKFRYAQVLTLWLPALLLTELSAFLYSPLRAVILFHWLFGLQLPLGY